MIRALNPPIVLLTLPGLALTLLLSMPALGLAQPAEALKAANLPPELSLASPELERRIWNKVPIRIALPVNRERLVTFNVPVRVELPADLDAGTLRTQIVADTGSGTIYWTALKAFASHRIQVQDIGSGNIYLVDLEASANTRDSTRIEVTVPDAKGPAVEDSVPAASDNPEHTPADPDPVSLTRMAAQHLYAPERLLRVPDGVYRTPVRQVSSTALVHGGKIEATPLIAWRAGELYITAVKLRNLTSSELILDPRTLRGHWQMATFQHNLLKPQGSVRDTTAAYLISSRPFEERIDGY